MSKKYNEKLQQAEQAFQNELQNYQDQINAYINTHPQTKLENPINISSPTQLAELFYDVLQVSAVSRKTPRGTGEEILEKMGHPLGKLILEYRGIAKLLNTYIDKMPEILNKKTGRIHCSYNQYGADCIAGDTVIKLKHGFDTIENICKSKYPNMEPNVFYDLDVCVINRYGAYEHTSHCIKFENVPTIKLIFNDGSKIKGTYDHPILCNNEFKYLKDIDFGDYVDCADLKTKLKVIGKEFTITDVYDFKVPLTHSFISNNVISHNTGRFSSNSPNLQNIPSRGEGGEIRKIFVATKEIKEDVKDNKLDLLIQDEVQTLTGWKNVEELTVNDIIICDDGNHKITNVQINGKQVLIEID